MIGRKSDPEIEPVPELKGFDAFELKLGDIMRGERATMGKSLLDVQRELKIKASYIAAVENSDPSAFETKGFIAGYVRSYARYLELDPDWAYSTFCEESAFDGVNPGIGPAKPAGKPSSGQAKPRPLGGPATGGDGLASAKIRYHPPGGDSVLGQIQPAAVASVAVLLALIGGLGYGGWAVLQEIQRVQFAPVDQAPGVAATLDPLDAVPDGSAEMAGLDAIPGPDALDRLYRPQELDMPVMVARDGPISSLDPGSIGAYVPAGPDRLTTLREPAPQSEPAAPAAPQEDTVQVTMAEIPEVEIFAVRPAWVRISASDGTVLFEKILDAGERYALPESDEAPLLRAGNSGSVYFSVDGTPYGPAGAATSVAKNVSLAASDIQGRYDLADLPDEMLPAPRPAVAEASTQ
ncbi:DUF4115 domain-containing protein [Maritimibacter sp. 55A14]|uniref:helix-turn-helix domain-containing protein n=1 Tax=Maritimibacter sp. 55A14 TaxID=2174844 RepID=UPI000D611F18|nr:helix-turn-helix domain-containing protein [Maritimibacter sp. 55A14]PWE34175.1 DUF4115 domain-containing protein [Maritimibacter sp. 55A14]